MSPYYVLETEKAYNLQQKNTYTIVFLDKRVQPNKIEVVKLLRGQGKNPVKVRSLNPYRKIKTRGKQFNKVKQFRFKKYFITLPAGEILENPKENNQQ